MMHNERKRYGTAGFFIAIGLIAGMFLLGHEIGKAIIAFKSMNREVVVKGLAEKEMPADLAMWPLQFSSGNDSAEVLTRDISEKNHEVVSFLQDQGFSQKEITVSPLSITDHALQSYYSANKAPFRYSAKSTVTLYTRNVDAVMKAMRSITALGEKGVAIDTDSYDTRPRFFFTRLNDIKPEMLDHAIDNAHDAAVKFARQSNSRLGHIRHASQGVFSVENRDQNTPYIKKIRVVSTLSYYLVN